jgi:hypothetical protein
MRPSPGLHPLPARLRSGGRRDCMPPDDSTRERNDEDEQRAVDGAGPCLRGCGSVGRTTAAASGGSRPSDVAAGRPRNADGSRPVRDDHDDDRGDGSTGRGARGRVDVRAAARAPGDGTVEAARRGGGAAGRDPSRRPGAPLSERCSTGDGSDASAAGHQRGAQPERRGRRGAAAQPSGETGDKAVAVPAQVRYPGKPSTPSTAPPSFPRARPSRWSSRHGPPGEIPFQCQMGMLRGKVVVTG